MTCGNSDFANGVLTPNSNAAVRHTIAPTRPSPQCSNETSHIRTPEATWKARFENVNATVNRLFMVSPAYPDLRARVNQMTLQMVTIDILHGEPEMLSGVFQEALAALKSCPMYTSPFRRVSETVWGEALCDAAALMRKVGVAAEIADMWILMNITGIAVAGGINPISFYIAGDPGQGKSKSLETINKMRQWVGSSGPGSLNVFGMAAATAAIQQDADGAFTKNERMRNKAVREMVSKWFNDRGMKPTDAQANFMFVNIGTPARAFRDQCRAKGVIVARDFPPFEKTHARISLGTMDAALRTRTRKVAWKASSASASASCRRQAFQMSAAWRRTTSANAASSWWVWKAARRGPSARGSAVRRASKGRRRFIPI